jgi:hypothetical protein
VFYGMTGITTDLGRDWDHVTQHTERVCLVPSFFFLCYLPWALKFWNVQVVQKHLWKTYTQCKFHLTLTFNGRFLNISSFTVVVTAEDVSDWSSTSPHRNMMHETTDNTNLRITNKLIFKAHYHNRVMLRLAQKWRQFRQAPQQRK